MSENQQVSVIARRLERGALSVEAETGGILPFVRALQIPSPGWERARVKGIKKQIVTILFLSRGCKPDASTLFSSQRLLRFADAL